MSHFGVLTSFDHTANSWSIYKSRINQWFIANEITSTTDEQGVRRRGILLSALSEKTYKLAADLALPRDIQDVPFEDIIKLLDAHFTRKRLGFTERFKFYSAVQNAAESDAEFIARLRGLSRYCEFKDAEEALRDRFVLGLRPGPARDKLFEQNLGDLTLANALKIAERISCVQEINDAQKWGMPFFGKTREQPNKPTLVSGTKAQTGQGLQGLRFGTQSGQGFRFGGTQPSGGCGATFGATQSSTAASFGKTQSGQAGFFGTQTQSTPTFGGTQTQSTPTFGGTQTQSSSIFGGTQTGQAALAMTKSQSGQAMPSGETKTKQDQPATGF